MTDTLTMLEWTSVVLNIAFTLLIAFNRRIGWLLGLVASTIGVGLYVQAHTWAMTVLNGYYVAMAVYGWWSWGRAEEDGAVRTQHWGSHAVLAAAALAASWLLAALLGQYLDGHFPQLDAFVTVFSLVATWMMARKFLASWCWFIVADSVGIWLNWQIGYQGYALLNAVYLVLSVVGLVKWNRLRDRRPVGEA